MDERVFIAWGGNQNLANLVGKEISLSGYEGIVGGGAVESLYIGSQVFSQIKKTTRAIILVQSSVEGNFNLNDNLMFEWGYLVAKFPPDKIHVFLINMNAKDLPSDLAGSWAQEIHAANKTPEEVAKEIAGLFCMNAARQHRMDKFDIVHNYHQIKNFIVRHNTDPQCSDGDLAYYIFHCMEAAYYYMDEKEFFEAVNKLTPISTALEVVSHIAKSNVQLFKYTDNLQKALNFDDYYELKLFFESPIDLSMHDEELDKWVHMITTNRLGLCNFFVAKNDDLTEEEKTVYLRKAIDCFRQSLSILEDIVAAYPNDRNYTFLYEGYFYRDLANVYSMLGDTAEVKKNIAVAVNARKQFFIYYKQRFPHDTLLNNRFAEEYYVALVEHVRYTDDIAEKNTIRRTIGSYLAKLEDENLKQHTLITKLKNLMKS